MTNEAFARIKIDQLLKDTEWRLTDGISVRYEYPLDDGGRADYALFDRQGRALAVLEANLKFARVSRPAPREPRTPRAIFLLVDYLGITPGLIEEGPSGTTAMQIRLTFDSYAQAAPQAFRDAITAAATLLSATFENAVVLNITIGYGEYPGDGSAEVNGGASAGPASGGYASYSQVRTWLAGTEDAAVQTGVAALPATTAIQGSPSVLVWRSQQKVFGQIAGNAAGADGYAGFATNISTSLLEGVALHELTHVMGRVPSTTPDIFDLFRFTSQGTRLFSSSGTTAAYFSLDGGKTHLADYGRTSDPSDFLNSSSLTPNDPFNETYSGGTAQALTPIDRLQLQALGYIATPTPPAQLHANDLAYSAAAQGPSRLIDLLNFEAGYKDLILAFGNNQNAMQTWYQTFQPIEHRVGTFDGLDYIASYSDLIAAFRGAGSQQAIQDAGASHYITNGLAEGRVTSFNALDYIASNTDLIASIGLNAEAGAMQFIQQGSTQGRTTTFDGLDYIASYKDLIAAFGANEQAGAAHFITSGYHEGRTTTFDGLAYIANYTDLMKAFGANNDAGATHYITFGLREGRTTTFDVKAYQAVHTDLQGTFSTDKQFLTAYIDTYVRTGHLLT